MNFDLLKILNDNIVAPFVSPTTSSKTCYPSSASVKIKRHDGTYEVHGACLRNLWYAANNFLSTNNMPLKSHRLKRILKVGNMYADLITDEVKEAGLYVASEVRFEIPEYNIVGRVDLIIKDPTKSPPPPTRPNTDSLIGVEFKTTSGYYKKKGPIISTKDCKLAPEIENVVQVACYLYYYKKYGIKEWILFYIDRGLGDNEGQPYLRLHTISLDSEDRLIYTNDENRVTLPFTIHDVMSRFAELNNYINTNVLPPRDYSIQYDNKELLRLYRNNELSETDRKSFESKVKRNKVTVDGVVSLPNPVLEKGDPQCSWCPYNKICYSDTPNKKPSENVVRPLEHQDLEADIDIDGVA